MAVLFGWPFFQMSSSAALRPLTLLWITSPVYIDPTSILCCFGCYWATLLFYCHDFASSSVREYTVAFCGLLGRFAAFGREYLMMGRPMALCFMAFT